MQKSKQKHPNKQLTKPKSTGNSALAPMSRTQGKGGKRWSLGASWDGFGVKAGLKLDSRSQPNAVTTLDGPRFRHSEVIATLKSPPSLSSSITVAHVFQPGMHTQFPWLANTAGGFQQYRVRKAEYVYEPFSSVFAAGGVQGRVSMFFDYSVVTPLDENIDDMLNKAPSINVQSAVGARLPLNPKFMIDNTRMTKNLRLDDQSLSTNYDAYDAGRLIIGLDQFTAAVEFGKIVVNYEIEFLIPASQKIPDAVGRSAMLDSFYAIGGWVGGNGVPVNMRASWTHDSANAGNVTLNSDDPIQEFFLMEEGFYMVIFNFVIPYNAGNSLTCGSTNMVLDSVQSEYLAIASPVAPATFTAWTMNGSTVLGVHGGGGRAWPLVTLFYNTIVANPQVRVDFVLLA